MESKIIIFLLSINIIVIIGKPVKENLKSATCQNCHQTEKEKINVHLIAHSHDDVGWLKTVDQYYYGSGGFNTYENAGVQYIISSAIAALKSHPDRRFIQVETAFFWKWWQNQNEQVRQDMVDLVNNGQLEIINGAWSMNDEAATHYHSIIDQFTWGFRVLNNTLGECARPKIGWQIDPFGHSREHVSLLSQMGFEALIIGRIDYRDKDRRKTSQNLEFLWNSSDNLENPNMFTSMFPDLYTSEPGFCFDVICYDRPINDDIESSDYNLQSKVEQFSNILDTYKSYYKTSNILIPMGGDFHFQAAEINFANLDKLIKGFKDHKTYNVFYSTPSCYVRAVNEELKNTEKQLDVKNDDFFPYASDAHSFWTGYYSSRPTSKRYERQSNKILQSIKQLASFSKPHGIDIDEDLILLKSAMGIMQHHDAITGTEKRAVAKDYAKLLTKALRKAEENLGTVVRNLLKKSNSSEWNLQLTTCFLANVSICAASTQKSFIVAVYNPLGRVVNRYVRLPVNYTAFTINGPDGIETYDVFDGIHKFNYIQEESEGKLSRYELVFRARDVPPLGINLFFIQQATTDDEYKPFKKLLQNDGHFGTPRTGFNINTETGRLKSVTINSQTLEIRQDFLYYTGSNSYNSRGSGAYIFRPTETAAIPVSDKLESFLGARGNLVDEFKQVFNNEVTQIIRVYKEEDNEDVEFDWLVGDLQYVDQKGKEVITRFTANNFTNNGKFYTDSNGRQEITRYLNRRGDYDYDPTEEPVSSNYYPVSSKIAIEDRTRGTRIAVLNDRAQGGSSLNEGSIELMIHRRCTRDDEFGVGEVLAEKQYGVGLYVRGQHYLTFGSIQKDNDISIKAKERILAIEKLLAPWITLSVGNIDKFDNLKEIENLVHFRFQGLTKSLPDNIHILTFEPHEDDNYILRLEHLLEKSDDEVLSAKVLVNLKDIFSTLNITEIQETTLGANQVLQDYENEFKLNWNSNAFQPLAKSDSENPLEIELAPMQIRTFIVKVEKK